MTKSLSLISTKQLATVRIKGGWQAGPNFLTCSKYGSKGSNSKVNRGRQHYACGVARAYIGDIMQALQENYKARKGHK